MKQGQVTGVRRAVARLQKRAFGDLKEAEFDDLVEALKEAATDWADQHNIGGLSHAGKWDVYQAIHEVPKLALEWYNDENS